MPRCSGRSPPAAPRLSPCLDRSCADSVNLTVANYAIKHRDEFERMDGSGECTWLLARKALGTGAFGYNLVEIAPGGQIPEHDEAQSGQVELYAILEGEATM